MIILYVMINGLMIILPLGILYFAYINQNYRRVGMYLGGGNVDRVSFQGPMDQTQRADFKNYYMTKYFGEDILFNVGVYVSLTLIFIMFGVVTL
jgi:ech hydrogenase subunit A